MFICLWVAYGCFHTVTADLSSCDRSLQILKYLLSFTERICLHGSQSCHGEGACVIQWSYEPCCAGPPKTDGHRTILTNCGPLEEEMAIHSSILARRTSWTVWKDKKVWHWKMSPRLEGVQYATGEEWREITNSSRKNEAAWLKRKWCPVVDVSGNESKVQCCKEQCCIELGLLGPWIKINWMWSSRRWQDWTLTS